MTLAQDEEAGGGPELEVEDDSPVAEEAGEMEDTDHDAKKLEEEIKIENEDDEDENEALFKKKHRQLLLMLFKICLALLVVVYLLAAWIIDFRRAVALFVITVLVLAYQIYQYAVSKNTEVFDAAEDSVIQFLDKCDNEWKYGGGLASVLVVIMVIIMAATVRDGRNMVSLFGLLVFLGLTWLFSWKPRKVKLRPVIGAVFIQFIFGFIVIRTRWGLAAVSFLGDIFNILLSYTYAGSEFVFGWLTNGQLFGTPFQLENGNSFFLSPPFFFNVLPTVIFFSSLMSVGYYLGVLPWLVKKLGYFLGIILGTSASESLSAAGNIFVGQTEAPLLVRPFMAEMTESELHAIMTGGFATIAGSVYGLYISFGIPSVAIIAASIMSAPAALAISKITYPETEESPTAVGKKGAYHIPVGPEKNAVHAATTGAVVGTQLLLNIAGNLIAFLALLKMLDELLIYLGSMVNIAISFNRLCEVFFWPAAWLMGVDAADCDEVARCLGLKVFANELIAYEALAFELRDQISDRSFYIASYALCGFSNIGSIGIQLGGLTPLAPNQEGKLAKLVISAMIAGNTACWMTACIAGIFYEP